MNINEPRGIRNNNPGNIDRQSDTRWVGMSAYQPDSRFISFTTLAYGIRAMCRILLTYRSEGYNSVAAIITKWAPGVENDTADYISNVAKHLGVAANVNINLTDPHELSELVQAICIHENGAKAVSTFIHPSNFAEGVALALN